MLYLRLFIEYCKIGLFSIGGGLATLPFIYELMYKTGWFDMTDITNMVAVSESTPGPMGVNMATYVGNIIGGIPGGIIATLGLVSPSLIIIIIVAHFLKKFKESQLVNSIMVGLRPASMGLIISASLSVALVALFNTELYKTSGQIVDLFNIKAIIFAIILIIAMRKTKLHPICFIGIAAIVGIVLKL